MPLTTTPGDDGPRGDAEMGLRIDNRTLILMRYIVQSLTFMALVGALVWGFVTRIINGEAYLGFVVAILTFLRDRPVFMLEEEPKIVGATARPLPTPDDRASTE